MASSPIYTDTNSLSFQDNITVAGTATIDGGVVSQLTVSATQNLPAVTVYGTTPGSYFVEFSQDITIPPIRVTQNGTYLQTGITYYATMSSASRFSIRTTTNFFDPAISPEGLPTGVSGVFQHIMTGSTNTTNLTPTTILTTDGTIHTTITKNSLLTTDGTNTTTNTPTTLSTTDGTNTTTINKSNVIISSGVFSSTLTKNSLTIANDAGNTSITPNSITTGALTCTSEQDTGLITCAQLGAGTSTFTGRMTPWISGSYWLQPTVSGLATQKNGTYVIIYSGSTGDAPMSINFTTGAIRTTGGGVYLFSITITFSGAGASMPINPSLLFTNATTTLQTQTFNMPVTNTGYTLHYTFINTMGANTDYFMKYTVPASWTGASGSIQSNLTITRLI
jgi:hypothetical protein